MGKLSPKVTAEVADHIKKYRKGHPGVDREFREVEKIVPKIIRKQLEETHPD